MWELFFAGVSVLGFVVAAYWWIPNRPTKRGQLHASPPVDTKNDKRFAVNAQLYRDAIHGNPFALEELRARAGIDGTVSVMTWATHAARLDARSHYLRALREIGV